MVRQRDALEWRGADPAADFAEPCGKLARIWRDRRGISPDLLLERCWKYRGNEKSQQDKPGGVGYVMARANERLCWYGPPAVRLSAYGGELRFETLAALTAGVGQTWRRPLGLG